VKCQEAKQLIVTFIDNELNECDEKDLFQHLSSCGNCSAYLELARETDDMLKMAVNYIEPPKDFARQVMLCLEEHLQHEGNVEDGSVGETIAAAGKEEKRKKWLSKVAGRWIRTGVAASIAVILLFGSFGLSGSASMNDSLAKRVFLISRDGISGIRRVVDNVISFAQNDAGKDKKEEPPQTEQPEVEPPVIDEAPLEEEIQPEPTPEVEGDGNGNGFDVALKEEDSARQETDNLPPASVMKEDPGVKMTAVVSPVIVTEGINNLRPVWVDEDTVYYLSEKRAPKEGTYVIWETNSKGTSRRMVSSPGYCMSLDHGGGVWSSYYSNYAFVTNVNGYWQTAYCSLKGRLRMAVSEEEQTAAPAQGVLWEYNPAVSSKGEIAFLTKRFGNVDLLAADTEGRLRVISRTPENESNPVWSEDGARIAFVRYSTGSNNGQLIVADKYGKNSKAVSPSISGDMVPAWSPDGKQLAVNINGSGDKKGLWLVNSDGSGWRKISDKGGGKVAAWSSDGKMIAFTDNLGQLYVWDATTETADSQSLIKVEPVDQKGSVEYVAWAPKSRQLLLEWKGEQTKTKAVWRAEVIKF